MPQKATGDGPLSGIPFGAKDIMETAGLATEYGSPVYKGRIGAADAAIVRELRQRGAILFGKTQTTAFAYRTPAPTRNPRNLDHTPGGSSSGSAAAVAAGMVPLALGTQTRGSVLRPASYCGVTGFKASYGLFSLEGVLPFAKSLDTLGFFTHSPIDTLALWESLGRPLGQAEDFAFGAPDPMPEVDPVMAAAFQRAIAGLRRAGVAIRSVDIAGRLSKLDEAATTVMFYEGARFHQQRYQEHGARLADLADLVREGLMISVDRYDEARRYIAESQAQLSELYKATPVILVPAATGPPPMGLSSTGDPRMNAPWTALGTPAISIPMPVGSGLPLGLQLTADHGQDARVIRAAVRVQPLVDGRG
jgi:Asp-tRNA(Asn)/Glu-tRNA(Gln) amidotransferase A subunit family amidase